MKKLLSTFLSVLLILSVCPMELFTVPASAETTSGTCGTNVTWQYDTVAATLTISGTGAMNNYSASSYNGNYVTTVPWRSYYQSMKTVIITSGVTSIGNYAFYYCTGLTSVTISDSVTSIGNYAFSGCTGLTSVTIPDSVTSIGYYAFSGCTGLTSITIPDSVTSIGVEAFSHCTGLTSVTIPDSVTSIGGYAFSGTAYYNNTNDWENCVLYIGNHLIGAKSNAVSGSYTVRAGTKTITDSAFYGCSELTTVTIPDSVTSIGDSAFSGCTGLTSITIPDSVISIGNSAFSGCSDLKTVIYCGTEDHWEKIAIDSGNVPLMTAKRSYHLYSEWQTVTAFSCISSGTEQRVCIVCGKTGEQTIPAHHTEQILLTVAPTCTGAGYRVFNCTTCGIRRIEEIHPLGHECGEVLTVAADCVNAGYHSYTCLRCGDEVRIDLPAQGHLFVNGFCLICSAVENIGLFDLNGDTELNAADLSVLQSCLLTDDPKVSFDLNADGVTNILDLIRLKKQLVA